MKKPDRIIEELKAKGLVFSKGLTERQLQKIEVMADGKIPQDLRGLLAEGVPIKDSVNSNVHFPRWDKSLRTPLRQYNRFIEELFLFDIKANDFWHESLGAKPKKINDAQKQALKVLRQQPRFIPVQLMQIGMLAGYDNGPVLSYHGPLDTVGWSTLGTYLNDRFKLGIEDTYSQDSNFGELPFWSQIFESSYN